MQFQLINNQGNEKKKDRLQKELNNFLNHLQTLAAQSQYLLSLVQAMPNRKLTSEIVSKLKK